MSSTSSRASIQQHIGVAVENGVVTLTGHVPTYAQKATVEDVVRHVKGVKGIAEEIEVRPFGTHKTADDEIAKRAVNTINWNTAVPSNAVQIKVQNGWLTLTGNVEWQYQKAAAAWAVRGLAGVVGLTNEIEVKPHASASDVKKRIEDALKRNAEVEANAIRVNSSRRQDHARGARSHVVGTQRGCARGLVGTRRENGR